MPKTKKEKYQEFKSIIEQFPAQLTAPVSISETGSLHGPFSSTIICGMGGSALAGEILQGWLNSERRSYRITIWRDYELPYFADKTSLFICVSYSGNTEETLSAFETARALGATIVGVSSGGKLETLCHTHHIPHVKITAGIPPRLSTGYLFNALANILFYAKILPDLSSRIQRLGKDLDSKSHEDGAHKMAKKMLGTIPLIYTDTNLSFLAHNIKTKLNENAKIHAFFNVLPELNHNEMVGFTVPQAKNIQHANFFVLFLEDRDWPAKIKMRVGALKQLLSEKGYVFDSLFLNGKNVLEKVFQAIMFGDLLSYYLAIEEEVDPQPVDTVEEFKRKIK